MSKLQIFLIPGLGLSRRFFENLIIEYGEVTYLDWIEPNHSETLKDYARRISASMGDLQGEVVLIGHSFGGIIAQEIGAIRPVKQVILISSMMSPEEAPDRLKLLGKYGLHRLISKELILLTFPFWARTHSYRTSTLRALFRESVHKLSSHYFRWSLFQIARWNGFSGPEVPILRIHGTRDVTFLIRKIDFVDHVIPGGNHNMIYLRGAEISKIINEQLGIISASKMSF